MTETRMAKGRKSCWGVCDAELKTKVPERMHDHFLAMAGTAGLDRAELFRDILGERMYGHLQVVTRRPTDFALSDPLERVSTEILSFARDHLAALATLEGMSVAEYHQQIIYQHLYGDHGVKVLRDAASENDVVRAG